MVVRITKVLEIALQEDGLDPLLFAEDFAHWKSGDEYGSYFFGKDCAYIKPDVDGVPYVLRHVHLVPLGDEDQLIKWNKNWKFQTRKTSDRALVYVSDEKGNHLLIFILDEPDAHDIAAMKTAEHREIMEGLAHVAAAFIDTGRRLN